MTTVKEWSEKSLVERWEATHLLDGITSPAVKESVAACFEAQRNFNEENANIPPAFRRVSIPIIRRAIATSEAVKRNTFVSIAESSEQKPQIYVFNTKYEGLPDSQYELTPEQENQRLDSEANYVADYSNKFREEFDRAFKDQVRKRIYFKGLNCNNEGVVVMFYNLL